MDEDHHQHRGLVISPIFIGLVGIVAGAIIVATYHLLVVGCCHLRRVGEVPTDQTSHTNPNSSTIARSNNIPARTLRVPLPPSVRYVKEYNNEETCSVCLCDFNEGERIRLLPECLHLFHVDCIDKWLHSHLNCPLCRATALAPAPPPAPRLALPVVAEEASGGARLHEIIHHQVILVDG